MYANICSAGMFFFFFHLNWTGRIYIEIKNLQTEYSGYVEMFRNKQLEGHNLVHA